MLHSLEKLGRGVETCSGLFRSDFSNMSATRKLCYYIIVVTFSSLGINRIWLPIDPACDKLNRPVHCSRSRLKIRPRETGSAVVSRVSPLIIHSPTENICSPPAEWLIRAAKITLDIFRL